MKKIWSAAALAGWLGACHTTPATDVGEPWSPDELRGGKKRDQVDLAAPADLATAPPDLGSAPVDLATAPPDMTTPLLDMSTTPTLDLATAPTDLATGGGLDCRNAASWPATWVSYEDQVLVLVNQRRAAGATCGGTVFAPVPPLVMNAQLREASRCHSLDMATQNYFSHYSLDGRNPWQRMAEAMYTATGTSENIGAGYSTPSAVVAGWMASAGHCAGIMAAGSNETGIGYAFKLPSFYGAYWTETFGRR